MNLLQHRRHALTWLWLRRPRQPVCKVPLRRRLRYSLVARRSGVPLARLRLTGEGDEVVLLYPSHRGWEPPGDFGAVAMPLDLALEQLSANPYFLELRQTYC